MVGVFLSHNTVDKVFARKLGEHLTNYGIKVWIDEAEIKVGEPLVRKISQGIQEMQYLAVILTPDSVSSSFVQKELELAITSEITGQTLKVLPILYKECEIPFFLKDKLYADFRNDFDMGFQKLLDVFFTKNFFDQIIDVVRNGAKEEFDAYKKLPKIYQVGLDKYFTKNGSAKHRILNVLKKSGGRGWVISNEGNPSTYEGLEAKVTKFSGDSAQVITTEYWYLRWYCIKEEKYKYIYNVKNKQDYVVLRLPNGIWKIEVNAYPESEAIGEPIQELLG